MKEKEHRRIQPAPHVRRVRIPDTTQYVTGPRRVQWSHYWQRYLDEGVVVLVPEPVATVLPIDHTE